MGRGIHVREMEEVTLEDVKTLEIAPLGFTLTDDEGIKYDIYEGITRLFKIKSKEQ